MLRLAGQPSNIMDHFTAVDCLAAKAAARLFSAARETLPKALNKNTEWVHHYVYTL